MGTTSDVLIFPSDYNFSLEHKNNLILNFSESIKPKYFVDTHNILDIDKFSILYSKNDKNNVEKLLEDIDKNFGNQIVELVDGLTKINKYSLKVKNQKFGENYKKLILATTKDLRVILVKLADRLHNMRTIQFIKDENKKIFLVTFTRTSTCIVSCCNCLCFTSTSS